MQNHNVKFCIFLDRNQRILVGNDEVMFRYYEEEAIRCVHSIRTNGGRYSDCEILVGYSSSSGIRGTTIYTLSRYDVTFIDMDCLQCSRDGVPEWYGKADFLFAGPLAFQIVCSRQYMFCSDDTRLVYLDLDVELFGEIPDEVLCADLTLFSYGREKASYDKSLMERWENLQKSCSPCFNTYIVAHDPSSGFFYRLNRMMEKDMETFKTFYRDVECGGKESDGHYFEESVYDYSYGTLIPKKYVNVLQCEDYEGGFFRHSHIGEKELIPLFRSITGTR